jgi:hypothetical protein
MPHLPEIPAFDSALGLISALLLLAAAVYLVRARSNATPGLPSLQHGRGKDSAGGDLFAEFVPNDTAWRLSLVGSMFLHVLLVAALPVIQLLVLPPLSFDLSHYDVVILQYQIRDAPLTTPSDLALATHPAEGAPEVPSQRDPLGLPEAENEQTQKAEGPGSLFGTWKLSRLRPWRLSGPSALRCPASPCKRRAMRARSRILASARRRWWPKMRNYPYQ